MIIAIILAVILQSSDKSMQINNVGDYYLFTFDSLVSALLFAGSSLSVCELFSTTGASTLSLSSSLAESLLLSFNDCSLLSSCDSESSFSLTFFFGLPLALPGLPAFELFRSFLAGGGGVAGTPFAADLVLLLPSTSGPKSYK